MTNPERDPRDVFVVGLDDFHRRDLENVPDADRFRFHPLLHTDDVVYREEYDLDALLERAREVLRRSPRRPEAIIGHWDFPVTVMVPILCAELGLRAPSLESVLKCSHKYWSRLEQREAMRECTPDFCAVDPFADRPFEQVEIDFPFWLKPVKGYGSALGFRIDGREDFERAIGTAREEIGRLGDPFEQVLGRVELPRAMRDIGGSHMIAERFVGGWELAPEGYVQDGRFHAHGTIDMVRGENRKSFQRYEYPSRAPKAVQDRAQEAAERVLAGIGLDDGCFNMEFFWNRDTDRLWIIEINPRISQSHSKLFAKVDGTSNHEVAIHVALGEPVRLDHGSGHCRRAAKFLRRLYERRDGVVTRVPGEEDLARLRERQPGTVVSIDLREGMRLSELKDQDPYSWILAELVIGADDPDTLLACYEEAVALLPFEVELDAEAEADEG